MKRLAISMRRSAFACCALLLSPASMCLVADPPARPWQEIWAKPHAPFKLFGNSYYVGSSGLSSVLITSPQGHVLIDGDLPESVPLLLANIKALGLRVEDIKLIVNSHTHFDHAGGIAELQRLSGAQVAASRIAAVALQKGRGEPNDPQYETVGSFPPVKNVKVVEDGKTLQVGPTVITVHYTPGHTPGGTTWTWKSCEQQRCLNMVYLDSLNAVSDPNFRFSGGPRYPNILQDFTKSIAVVEALPCDIAIAAHPELTDLWTKLEQREAGKAEALIDSTACRSYAQAAHQRLDARIASEKAPAR